MPPFPAKNMEKPLISTLPNVKIRGFFVQSAILSYMLGIKYYKAVRHR